MPTSVLEDQPLEATIEIGHGRLGLPGAEILDPLAGGSLALRVAAAHLRPRPRRAPSGRPLRAPRTQDTRAAADQAGGSRWRLSSSSATARAVRPGDPRAARGSSARGGSRSTRVSARLRCLRALVRDARRARCRRPPALPLWNPGLTYPLAGAARGPAAARAPPQSRSGSGTAGRARRPLCQAPGERLDQAVRAAASLAHYLARRGGCELLLPGERRPIKIESDLGSWPSAHARLAIVDGGRAVPAPALVQRPGSVLYVAAELRSEVLRGGATPFAGATLVLPADVASELRRRPIFEVAGCVGLAPALTRRAARLGARSAA